MLARLDASEGVSTSGASRSGSGVGFERGAALVVAERARDCYEEQAKAVCGLEEDEVERRLRRLFNVSETGLCP